MRQLVIILISLSLKTVTTFSQDSKHFIKNVLTEADSVILISHEPTAGMKIINDSTGKEISLPKLIINGKPNQRIIQERQILTGLYLDSLINILDRPFQDKTIEVGKCFIPHHAIFIVRKGKTSYINICFSCRQFETSKDLNSVYSFDNRKWKELERFFIRLGFRYELEELMN